MTNIRDKVAKLLALADSPNEGEARAALLKARELMAQYKLRPDECTRADKLKVKKECIEIQCSKTKYSWAIDLSTIIARNYCCKAFHRHRKYERMYTIGFVGLEDDFDICTKIFRYAFDCVKSRADEIFRKDDQIYTSSYRRSMAEAYGFGFCSGLASAFKRQERQRGQEWGLVLVVPKEVEDATKDMADAGVFADVDLNRTEEMLYALEGQADGRKFDPGQRIEKTRPDFGLLSG